MTESAIAQPDAKLGKSFDLVSKDKIFADYFKEVTVYHKTINSVRSKEDETGKLLGHVFGGLYFPYETEIKVIAVARVTRKPIACVIDYSKGSLIFLPQSDAEPVKKISQLFEIGALEYERSVEKLEEHPSVPEWLDKHKTKPELDLEIEIRELTRDSKQLMCYCMEQALLLNLLCRRLWKK